MNPTVRFRYIDLTDSSLTWHAFAAPTGVVTNDHILNSVNWINDDMVGAFWLNRRQNRGSYQICSTIDDRSCYEVCVHSSRYTQFIFFTSTTFIVFISKFIVFIDSMNFIVDSSLINLLLIHPFNQNTRIAYHDCKRSYVSSNWLNSAVEFR